MNPEDEVISKQIDLMGQAPSLIQERIKWLTPVKGDPVLSDADSTVRIYQIQSLKRFKEILEFLAPEVRVVENKKCIYLLPNIRTLLDIYANFLHLELNCSNSDERAIMCIAHQLFIGKKLGSGDGNYKLYQEAFEIYKDVIQRTKPDFPTTPEKLSKKWMKENKLFPASKDILLTPENMNKFSSYSIQVFGVKKTYEIYSSISEILHGNPYYYKEESHNERFWIITMSLSTSAFLIEFIDRYILNKGESRDFREWLASCKTNSREYAEVWKRRKLELEQQG